MGAGELDLWSHEHGRRHIERQVPTGTSLLADGDAYAIQLDGSVTVIQQAAGSPRTTHVTLPTEQPIGLRLHAGTINLWDRQGRVVCVNPDHPASAVCLRTPM